MTQIQVAIIITKVLASILTISCLFVSAAHLNLYLTGLSSMMLIWTAEARCKWRAHLHNRMRWQRLELQTSQSLGKNYQSQLLLHELCNNRQDTCSILDHWPGQESNIKDIANKKVSTEPLGGNKEWTIKIPEIQCGLQIKKEKE